MAQEHKNITAADVAKECYELVEHMTHDIRTPAFVAREGVSQVLDGLCGPVAEAQREMLDISLKNIDRLTSMLMDFTMVSKIEFGQLKLEPENLDFVALTRAVTQSLSYQANQKKLEIKENFCEPQIEIKADRDHLVLLVKHLIRNAIQYTEQGEIEILISRTSSGNLELAIGDTGIGIDPADASKVFQKFQRFRRRPAVSEKGSGVGLWLAKKIAEIHGGTLTWENRSPRGTWFRLTLP